MAPTFPVSRVILRAWVVNKETSNVIQVVATANGEVIYQQFLYILAYGGTKALESDVSSMLGRIYTTDVLCSFKHAEEELLKETNHLLSLSGQQKPWKSDRDDGEDIFELLH